MTGWLKTQTEVAATAAMIVLIVLRKALALPTTKDLSATGASLLGILDSLVSGLINIRSAKARAGHQRTIV